MEEVLYRHPAVAEVGVIGEADPYWGELVLAFIALREGQDASAEELIAFAHGQMAQYKCPERVLFLPRLPMVATGKVRRRALQELRAQAANG